MTEKRLDAAAAVLIPSLPGFKPTASRRLAARALAAADRAEAPPDVRLRNAQLEHEREVIIAAAEERSGRVGLTLFQAVAELAGDPNFPFLPREESGR